MERHPYHTIDQLLGCYMGEDWLHFYNNEYEAAEDWFQESHESQHASLVREVDQLFLLTTSTEERLALLDSCYAFATKDDRLDVWLRAVRVRTAQALAGLPSEPLVDPTGAMMKVDFASGGPPSVFTAGQPWNAVAAQAEFVAALARGKGVPLPGIPELLDKGVDLVHHEAHGAETLLRYLGRDAAFLDLRVIEEPGYDGPTPKSSFANLDEAEWAVNQALLANRAALEAWPHDGARLALTAALGRPIGTVRQGADLGPVENVSVLLMRDENDTVVWLAHPDSRGPGSGSYQCLEQLLGGYLHEGWVYEFSDHYCAVNYWAHEVDESAWAGVVGEIDALFENTSSTAERAGLLPTQHVWSPEGSFEDVDVWLRAVRMRVSQALSGGPVTQLSPPGTEAEG
jgi:hypothetical protein